MFPENCAIVDVETTGGSPSGHRVIEIGIIRLRPGCEPVFFSSLVRPDRPVPPFIQELTGIRPADLENAPRFDELALDIRALLDQAVFVAHNARFDYAFVKHEMARLEIPFSAQTLCSARLSKALYPEYRKHNLSEIVTRFGLACANRHRALDDAKAVYEFMKIALKEKGESRFREVFSKLSASLAGRCLIPEQTLRELPETPGVYIFYGKDGETLYVGKSKNIRTRVLSHLYSDHRNGKTLSLTSRAAAVEARPTPGEVSALLLESKLIKSMRPKSNRRLLAKKRWVLLREARVNGFLTVRLSSEPGIGTDRDILGAYSNIRQAKEKLFELAGKRRLCAKLLGLEKTQGCCFAFHLKNCSGACTGQEPPESYNIRFREAFPGPLVEPWPYEEALLIDEHDKEGNQGEAFVVKDWRIRARIRYTEQGQETEILDEPFDIDTYKILRQALKNTSAWRTLPSAPGKPRPPEGNLRYEITEC